MGLRPLVPKLIEVAASAPPGAAAELGLQQSDAAWLRDASLAAAASSFAEPVATDVWGTHWRMDVTIKRSALARRRVLPCFARNASGVVVQANGGNAGVLAVAEGWTYLGYRTLTPMRRDGASHG
jgi:hypothetical protein